MNRNPPALAEREAASSLDAKNRFYLDCEPTGPIVCFDRKTGESITLTKPNFAQIEQWMESQEMKSPC